MDTVALYGSELLGQERTEADRFFFWTILMRPKARLKLQTCFGEYMKIDIYRIYTIYSIYCSPILGKIC